MPNKLRGICSLPNCNFPHRSLGFCQAHYYRYTKYGDPNISRRAPNGTGYTTLQGYRIVRTNGNKKYEHIQVMEDLLGRPLFEGESVHHKNGVKADNRPENLELWASTHPAGQRPADLVMWAKEILKKYGEKYGPLEY